MNLSNISGKNLINKETVIKNDELINNNESFREFHLTDEKMNDWFGKCLLNLIIFNGTLLFLCTCFIWKYDFTGVLIFLFSIDLYELILKLKIICRNERFF